jgi:hypothetical protein
MVRMEMRSLLQNSRRYYSAVAKHHLPLWPNPFGMEISKLKYSCCRFSFVCLNPKIDWYIVGSLIPILAISLLTMNSFTGGNYVNADCLDRRRSLYFHIEFY